MSNKVGTGSRQMHLMLPSHFKDEIRAYLKQDIPNFDIGAYVVGETPSVALLMAKTDGILAGVPFVNAVFEELGCIVEWHVAEREPVGPQCITVASASRQESIGTGQVETAKYDATVNHFKGRHRVATIKGPVHRLLQGERIALNILSRSSGIATETRVLVDKKNAKGWHGEIAATRKLTPGFRLVEKYSVVAGGGVPHRMDLSDMTMLKDNHVWACGGSIKSMVEKARSVSGFSNKIEVECQSLEEALEAAGAGAEIVMLDNFPPEEAKAAAAKLKERYPHGLTIEASGGMTPETMSDYFSKDVDVISFGRLTHGYGVVDFSMKIDTSKL